MNTNDNGGSSGTGNPASPDKDSASEIPVESSSDGAVVNDEGTVPGAQEDAERLHKDAADLDHIAVNAGQLNEEKVNSLEQEICMGEKAYHGLNKQMIMLQEANANLVIATIEAHKLAEKVEKAKLQLNHLAHHDTLTGLPNRILLQDRLSQAIELAGRQGRQVALMFMDLDRFKYINDSLGHAVGDQLLKSIAKRLTASMRSSDTVCRLGGDEFVLLLPNIEHAADVRLCAQKILAAFTESHKIDGHDIHIGVSIGISIYPDDGQDEEILIRNADIAMYYAKEKGRNNYQFFRPEMNIRAVQRQTIEASLRYALVRQEFMLYYQPKINLNSGKIVGVEALIRWQHPQQGLLLPDQFISIAEDCGLILPIGRWVLREACHQVQAWRKRGLPPVTMAINTSALEFLATGFLENIQTILDDICLEPNYLELELTESVLMKDAESTIALLNALVDIGVKLAVDDFGTGYSSLSYLRQFPIDTMKIDQSFVEGMTRNPDDACIVNAVISMGKSLKKRVVAEGVETPEQFALLLDQQCEEGQGYYFCRPVAAEAFADLLQRSASLTFPA
ncbi:MAG: EAL domain-containing protein [Methylococcales bacterium]|nr:EAL domain-containing protein [Methylococcales bacterium]